MPRRAALGLIACAACVPAQGAKLPDFQDAKSAIYAIGRSEDVGAFASSAGAPVAFTVDRDQTSIGVAFYARTLEEMFLRDGVLVADPFEVSHGLPTPSAAFLARLGDDGELGAFEPVPLDTVVDTAPFDGVTIVQQTPAECVTGEGCYDTTPDPICVKPCAPIEPVAPKPLTAPHVTCAPGWTPRKILPTFTSSNGADLSEVVTCDPTPSGEVPTCSDGQMWRPPLPGCVAVTRPCPIAPEKWPDDLPATGVVYVDRDTPNPPGDGSRSAPFASIAVAMMRAVAGSTVALAAQDFGEIFSVTQDLTVRGACASTIVDTINVDGRSSVRDLTVRPTLHYGIGVLAGARVSLSNLIVETQSSTRSIGIDLLGTTTVAHVLVNAHGYGIIAHGDRATILDTQIDGAQTFGIHVVAGTAQIARTVIHNGGASSGVLSYAFAEVSDSLIEGTGAASLHANGAGTVVAHRTVLRNIPRAYGMLAQGGGTIRADSLIIDGVDGFAIEVTERSSVSLEDSVVMNIHEPGGDAAGLVFLVDESELRARRTLFAHFDTTGIIFGRDAIGDLQDVAFVDLRSVDHAMTIVGRLSRVTVERALYFGSSNLAIRLVGDDFVDTPARLVMRDVIIDGAGADGIQASRAVDLTMERVSIANTRRAAIQVRETATARISDLTIDGVTEAKDECVFECTGFGIAAGIDSIVTVDRFLIQGAADTCALAGGGSLDLFHGIVRDCPVGVGADDRDYDLRRLLVDVDARGATEPVVGGR